jgi:hypothetical protein
MRNEGEKMITGFSNINDFSRFASRIPKLDVLFTFVPTGDVNVLETEAALSEILYFSAADGIFVIH